MLPVLIALLSNGTALAMDPARGPVVAVVSGFEIYENDVPGLRSQYGGPLSLIDPIHKIATSKASLQKIGIDSSPRAVEKWRDAKLAEARERAKVLREIMAHPERARSLYETTVSSSVNYEQWMLWTLSYRTEERIAAWENRPAVGHFRFDLQKGTRPSLWMLLESMVEEGYQKGRPQVPAYAEVLSPADIETLRSVGRAAMEDYPDMIVFQRGVENSSAAATMLDSMSSSIYLATIERDLQKILDREAVEKLKIEFRDPTLEKTREYLAKLTPGELTRAQVLNPMTVPDAVSALSGRNGNLAMAVLALSKSRKDAVAALLDRIRSKESRGLGPALTLLKWLDAREAGAVVRDNELWKSHDEGTYNGAFSLLGKLEPALLEPAVASVVADFENRPTFSGVGRSFVPSEIKQGMRILARRLPGRARPVLRGYLSSPKPGVRLSAGLALATIGDGSGTKYAFEFMEETDSDYERSMPLEIINRVGGQKDVRALDALSLRLKAPELAVTAREIEYPQVPANERWTYVQKFTGNANRMVDYWAFDKVEAGFRADDPGVVKVLEHVAAQDGNTWRGRAQELLRIQTRKKMRVAPRPPPPVSK